MNTPSAPGLFTLLLVDDHEIVREGLRRVLAPVSRDWQVVEAGNGFQALDSLRRNPVGLAIVDISMPGMNGLELVRRMKLEFPLVPVLVLSMHDEHQYARRAFKAGAMGYVTKDTAASELVAAVRKLLTGGAYVSAHLAERMVQELSGSVPASRLDLLSDRELDVVKRLVAGQRLTDIADALHLSIKTISSHKSRIQDKLQLPNIAALIRFGMDHGLDRDEAPFDPPGDAAAMRTGPPASAE